MTGDAAATENKAVLNITNGNFEITEIETLFSGVTNEALKKEKITVNGGTFSTDVTGYLGEGKVLQKNGDTYTAVTNSGITGGTYTAKPTVPDGYKVVENTDGTFTVEKVGGYYYYQPTTDTKTDDAKGSPKTADPGVALYAALSLLSLTGLTCTAKKR